MPGPEIETERLTRRPNWLFVLAFVLAIGAIAGVGIAGKATSTPSPMATSPVPSAVPASVAPAAVPVLRHVSCHGVGPEICSTIAGAAVRALPADLPEIDYVRVYGSLLCGSELDCPSPLLSKSAPLGSAVVGFVDGGPDAWIDVVELKQPPPARPTSWVVRWVARPRLHMAPTRAVLASPFAR